ncbi:MULTISPECIES: hypothetical protein [Kamptonema]|uniref:hypothetical protein n=1 Tax=Kamptonema TaxID=1501433 RepID=UPI0001DAD276|nr:MULTISPECIES: hypothetical protein [Kamptonema]CBN58287.1 hypothetical protein OSCI_3720006 [Kamptonema sp. PCC 6506]
MTKTGYGRRIDSLREQAARLGISKDEARKQGNLSKVVTWERAIAHALKTAPMQLARLPQSPTRLLNPPKIICPTCLGREPLCDRCGGKGKIFNLVRFRLRYFGTSRLPEGVLP